ncbi:MAG: MFS transporter [Acidobacteriota bacterium]
MNSSATIAAMSIPPTKLKALQTGAYFVAFITLGFTTAAIGPTLPKLASHLHTDLSAISNVLFFHSLGFLLVSFRGGKWYDRLRGHRLMALAVLAMAASMVLVPLMPTLWALIAVILFLGAAEGLVDTGANTLIVWVHGSRVAPFLNGLHFFYGVGAFLSPIIIAQTLTIKDDLAVPYWTLGLLVLPAAVLLISAASPPIRSHAHKQRGEPVNYRLVLLIALFLCLYVGAEVSFGSWIYSFVLQMNLSNETVAAYLTSLFWGALTVGRLLAVPIAARVKPHLILLADLAGCLISIFIALVWSGVFAAVLIATIGLGLSMASIFPSVFALAENRMKISGQVTGFFLVGASLGAMILPWLVGQLFEKLGARVLLFAVLAEVVLAVLVFALMNGLPQQKSDSAVCEANTVAR